MAASVATKNVTSPDLSVLGFSILYDISPGVPTITLTNGSTVIHPLLLKWWYVISMPDGTLMHEGSLGTPDVDDVAWTTLVMPEVWPTPFGNTSPKSQIEFSCSLPYICTLYVQDSAETTFSLAVPTTICRPSGNTNATQGNFGGAVATAKTDCANAELLCQDSTNYIYQGGTGVFVNNIWKLVYPILDAEEAVPTGEATNTSTALFPLYFTGKGYQIIFQSYRLYDQLNGGAVKLQYKFRQNFAVWCGIDLCALNCAISNLYQESLNGCTQVVNETVKQQLNTIALLLAQLDAALIQPFCGEDKVPALIAEIKRVGGFDCECDCPIGVNALTNSSLSPGNSIQVPVYMRGSETPPATCPNSYFPAKVYTPDGTTFIAFAYQAEDMVSILNSNGLWAAYGTWFPQGNCLMGLFPLQTGVIVPGIQIDLATDTSPVTGKQYYILTPTSTCGSGAISPQSFPFSSATVDFGAGPVALGTIADLAAYLTALNAATGKPAAVTFTASGAIYPLYITINNTNSALYSTPIVIDACGTLTGSQNLQSVTTGGGNNITTNTIIVGDDTADNTRMSETEYGLYLAGQIQAAFKKFSAGIYGLIIKVNSFFGNLRPNLLTADRTWRLPDDDGTLALLTDIPAITYYPLYAQTTSQTFNNVAITEQSVAGSGLGSMAVTPTKMGGNGRFRLTISGLLTNSFVNTMTVRVKFNASGATTYITAPMLLPVGVMGTPYSMEMLMTYSPSELKATGTFFVGSLFASPEVLSEIGTMRNQTGAAFDPTVNQSLVVTIQFTTGVGSGNSAVTIEGMNFELLKPA